MGKQYNYDSSEEDASKLSFTKDPHEAKNIQTGVVNGPVVVFYGPIGIGKTVTLLRLFNFLEDEFEMTANREFRPHDKKYSDTLKRFENARKRSREYAPNPNDDDEFILFDVTKNGRTFCQILEAPGEHFFSTKKRNEPQEEPDVPYLLYFNEILRQKYRKVFVFFFEIGMFDNDVERELYVSKIVKLIKGLDPKTDRIILLLNKCDLNPEWIEHKRPVVKSFRKNLYDKPYFSRLKKTLEKSNFDKIYFIVFSGGRYANEIVDGKKNIIFFSDDHYPEKLWESIHKCISGEWINFPRIKVTELIGPFFEIAYTAIRN